MAQRPTTEELARHILKRVYEHTEGLLEWHKLATNKTEEVAVELAVESGWLLVDASKGVCLTSGSCRGEEGPASLGRPAGYSRHWRDQWRSG